MLPSLTQTTTSGSTISTGLIGRRGNDLNIATVTGPAIAALGTAGPPSTEKKDIAFIDSGNDDLRTYRVALSTKILASTEWENPSDGTRIEMHLTDVTILTNQSGSWVAVKDSASANYAHTTTATKGMFVKGDGHLFSFFDGASNEIQAYREGADLDPAMSNGNTYEDAFGSDTHTMTGTWPTAAYLGAYVNSRLAWSTGSVLIEYTPMAHTDKSGVWDLLGSEAGAFHASGNIRCIVPFSPHLSNANEEVIFVGTNEGWEITSGFLSYDRLVRMQGARPPLNHKAYCTTLNWLVYLTDNKGIFAINARTNIDLGRRFQKADGTGFLDDMLISSSESDAFGFYNSRKKQAQFWFTTSASALNDRCAVLDFRRGEPLAGESKRSYERRVSCFPWKIKDGTTNDWFSTVYQTQNGPIGALNTGILYTLESGDNDLGSTIAIESDGSTMWFTGGDQAVALLKQWADPNLRIVPASGTTLTVEIFEDWSATASATLTKLLTTATVGDIVKFYTDFQGRTESIQVKFSNSILSQTYIISHLVIPYDIPGAEIKA
ncbi:hypothetical protein LCGC14_1573560 [marine sediment metagenome]|uniref:Uncharacterized protein n=1 Tax=marine sediment metagenome TaxID=412755 RepID=A0A0F9IJ27_9ZZZZ